MGLSEINSSEETILHEPELLILNIAVVTEQNLLQLKFFLDCANNLSKSIYKLKFDSLADLHKAEIQFIVETRKY